MATFPLLHYIVKIYENDDYPVVTHIFTGKNVEECMAYFNAHKAIDPFLAQCVDGGFYGGIQCHATFAWTEGNAYA